jgi:uncharacterized LabA/DUF88 family protein
MASQERTIVYIDGFNLYFGLKTKSWKRFYWLNVKELANNILQPPQALIKTKYFTSRITFPPDKAKRQGTFIEALETLTDFEIFYGKYQSNSKTCNRCGNIEMVPNEKMTDVNIAVEMLADAFQNLFDTAILVSADSDLTAPIKKIKRLYTNKRIVLGFPPERHSFALKQISDGSFTIGRKTLAKSVFPDKVTKKDGFVLIKPVEWI